MVGGAGGGEDGALWGSADTKLSKGFFALQSVKSGLFIYVNGVISRSAGGGGHLVLTRTRSDLLSKGAGVADGGPL